MSAEGDFKALIQAHRETIHNKNLYEVFGNKQLFCTALFILFISVKIIRIHKGQMRYSNFPLKIELTSLSQASRTFKKVEGFSCCLSFFLMSKCKNTKEKLYSHSMISCFFILISIFSLYFLRKVTIALSSYLKTMPVIWNSCLNILSMKWTESSASKKQFGRTSIN